VNHEQSREADEEAETLVAELVAAEAEKVEFEVPELAGTEQ
jgi:hypothetical protein